ncbi:histidine phosphatase family protein [Segetibacter sp. 3557_3]|uniref:SixA phosphatase family protein n=1 Tax=Segetibacter sp. 3557_3 TaxID=2547429 RepID=UPI001058D72E|nr:histidine phosphatase family protein [Segetibacter sp. 3557_3]TDH20872.1 histidine phosphatase family protein [Segetibacter sp. 3557_3]
MRKLLLVRHAKSSWDVSVPKDFDRSLNDRGNRDAPEMAKRILKRDVEIDALISSPAKRAFSTAVYFAEAYGIKEKQIIKVPSLYEAGVEQFYDTIKDLDNDLKTVVLCSHNPGITDFVNLLTGTHIDNMPTCGIFAVKAPIKKWKDFREAEKEFWFFDYPKLHL